jgi:RND family efflux transporter MFP subunit
MASRKPAPLLPFAGAVLSAVLAAGCAKSGDRSSAGPAEPPVAVRVATVTSSTLARVQPVPGVVRPAARATVAAKIAGEVATSTLSVGRQVSAGEVLLTLQAAEFSARAEQAQAVLAQAEREFERERQMETQGASTQESVRAADDRRRQARAAAEEASAMLGYARVAAPFDGLITEELVKPGDFATPGRALFTLEAADQLRAEVQVPESLPVPAADAPLTVLADAREIPGRLVEVSPAADPVARTRLAKISLPANSGARSGQFVRVLWPAGEGTALTVPADAVSVLGQMERVFVVDDGRVALRLVKTAGRDAGRAIVASGVDAGESVVVAPPLALRDGQRVEIRP